MTRISFNEQGQPIPTEALPDGLSESEIAAITFQPVNGEIFVPADWMAFGYTHYEVTCVGAAGGEGGTTRFRVAPPANRKIPGMGGDWSEAYALGGAGGGGGIHVVSGELADLPAECEVVVGEAGADGADGIRKVASGSSAAAVQLITPDHGDPGEDGGYSSFADTICMASGGKGGGVPDFIHFVGHTEILVDNISYIIIEEEPGGNGGDGGLGGTIVAGGGGAGAEKIKTVEGGNPTDAGGNVYPAVDTYASSPDGSDGTWDGEIGGGGGGGVGGIQIHSQDVTVFGG